MAADDATAGGARSTVPGRSLLVRAALWARRELPVLSWVFVICSVAGLALEEAYHLVVFHEVQSRAGLLFGPFSPVYGVGDVCVLSGEAPAARARARGAAGAGARALGTAAAAAAAGPLTGCCAVLMALDVAPTLVSFNCWYLRVSGREPQTLAQVVRERASLARSAALPLA